MVINRSKKRIKKNILVGIVHVYTSFNNSIVTVTDLHGDTITWSSCGSKAFKGSKKGIPFAAQMAAEEACKKAKDYGIKNIEVKIKGPGAGRESALRAIASSGLKINQIQDVTPIPYNGCRPSKRRRV